MKLLYLCISLLFLVLSMNLVNSLGENIPDNQAKGISCFSALNMVNQFKTRQVKSLTLSTFEKKMIKSGFTVSWGDISPDGTRIAVNLTLPDSLTFLRFGTINLSTGDFLEILPPGTEGKAVDHDDRLSGGPWDVTDPAYLYINYEKTSHNNDTTKTTIELWRVRFNGVNGNRISAPDEDMLINGMTPDGHWLIIGIIRHVSDNPVVDIYDRYFQSTDNRMLRKTVDWPDVCKNFPPDYSPDGNFLLRTAPDKNEMVTLQCCDLTTKRQTAIFSLAQIQLRAPSHFGHSGEKMPMLKSYYWLPDSSGCLLNIMMDEHAFELWHVSVDGQAQRISDKLEVLANSQNGRFFLFRVSGTYYLVSVPYVAKK